MAEADEPASALTDTPTHEETPPPIEEVDGEPRVYEPLYGDDED